MVACWDSCGGLGGDARFTMVSRGPSPPSSIDTIIYTLMPALPENREPIEFHK